MLTYLKQKHTDRNVYMANEYGPQMSEKVDAYKAKIETHEVTDIKEIKKEVDEKLSSFKKSELAVIERGLDAVIAGKETELNALEQKDWKSKQKAKALQQSIASLKESKKETLKSVTAELDKEIAKTKAELQTAIEQAKEKRKQNADKYAKSLSLELIKDEQKEREESYKTISYYNNFEKFGIFEKFGGAHVPVVQRLHDNSIDVKSAGWSNEQMEQATIAALKAVYIEHGPERHLEIAEKIHDNKQGETIDYETLRQSFSVGKNGNGRGSLQDTIDSNLVTADEYNPAKVGEVWGLMYSANETFGKKDDLYKKYKEYIASTLEKDGDNAKLLTPSMWAAENAPEEFLSKESANKMIDNIVEEVEIPEDATQEERDKIGYQKSILRNMLRGALNAAPKDADYDALIKEYLVDIFGKNYLDKIRNGEGFEQALEGKYSGKIYGDHKEMLDLPTQKYIEGMLYGAGKELSGEKYVDENGKPVDVLAEYKDYVKEAMEGRGNIGYQLKDLLLMSDKLSYESLNNYLAGNEQTAEQKKAIQDYFVAAQHKVLSSLIHPKDFVKKYKKLEEKKEEKKEKAEKKPAAKPVAKKATVTKHPNKAPKPKPKKSVSNKKAIVIRSLLG